MKYHQSKYVPFFPIYPHLISLLVGLFSIAPTTLGISDPSQDAGPSRPIAQETLSTCVQSRYQGPQFQGPEAQLHQEPLEMKIKSQQNCKDSWDSYQISSVKTKLCLKADSSFSFCDVKIKLTTKKPNQPRGILAGLEESSLLVLVNGRNPLANQLLCR